MTKPLYAHLSTGKRAGLTSLWNRYHSLAEVSRASGVTEDVIVAYLKTRDGYPGSITGARPPVGRRRAWPDAKPDRAGPGRPG